MNYFSNRITTEWQNVKNHLLKDAALSVVSMIRHVVRAAAVRLWLWRHGSVVALRFKATLEFPPKLARPVTVWAICGGGGVPARPRAPPPPT